MMQFFVEMEWCLSVSFWPEHLEWPNKVLGESFPLSSPWLLTLFVSDFFKKCSLLKGNIKKFLAGVGFWEKTQYSYEAVLCQSGTASVSSPSALLARGAKTLPSFEIMGHLCFDLTVLPSFLVRQDYIFTSCVMLSFYFYQICDGSFLCSGS